jgi:hypothetical protein
LGRGIDWSGRDRGENNHDGEKGVMDVRKNAAPTDAEGFC